MNGYGDIRSNPGDIVYKVYLSCGHVDFDIQRGANKKPAWMLYNIEKGMRVECPFGCGKVFVVNAKLIQGWGDK